MSVSTASPALAAPRPRLLEPAQTILVALLVLEIAVFAAIGTNFLSRANAFEVVRLSVEIGLLAVALTPVIVSGGIDLSVGSLMGLSAVALRQALARRRAADRRGRPADAGARRRWPGA